MKSLGLFLFLVIAAASADPVRKPTTAAKYADETFLKRQKDILELYYHPSQPSPYSQEIAKSYNIKENIGKYEHPEVVDHFWSVYKNKMLPQGRPFSIMYKEVLNETIALFELFYYAKDFDTFYKTACWAREHINEEMFVYAYTVALEHRDDCSDFYQPPIYEIFPNYAYSDEVIDRAYKVQMQNTGKHMGPYVYPGEGKIVYVEANYTNWYLNNNWEQRLAYFTEDIDWNSVNYQRHVALPFWMLGPKYFPDFERFDRARLVYFWQRQTLARYYAERLSMGMGEIPEFSWDEPIDIGYDPYLSYPNGARIPYRPNDIQVTDRAIYLDELKAFEGRIREAIDLGYAQKADGSHISLRKPEGISTILKMIEANAETPDYSYYGYPLFQARKLLGNSPHPESKHTLYPSVMELYQTSLRDPMFYQLLAKYHRYFFHRFESFLTPYTIDELSCPSVKIENVHVDKLITYMEQDDTEITNIVYETPFEKIQDDHLVIKVRQQRLNHVPFNVVLDVASEKAVEVTVRLFLGPKYNSKYDAIPLDSNRHNFYEIDQFTYGLKSGKNKIERNSDDFYWTDDDYTPARQVYDAVRGALATKQQYLIGNHTSYYGIPERLVLPRGTSGGLPYYLYVLVTPHTDVDQSRVDLSLDARPLGYPFDRPVRDEARYHLDNMRFEEVMIFFKRDYDVTKH